MPSTYRDSASHVRTLVMGATGLVGQELVAYLRARSAPSDEISGAGSADADLCDERAVAELIERHRPDWTVLAAALANVDACERDPERAHAVNALGPCYVARACRQTGSRLLFISTDYVFDGKKSTPYEPEDATGSLSVYGRSKAAGEEVVRTTLPDACVVRTSWVFGLAKPGFPGAILEQAERLPEVPVIADQTTAPTYAPDLAAILDRLMQMGARGTLHAAGANGCTRVEWAREILRAAGKENVPLRAVTNAQLHRPAPRPVYSVLSTSCLAQFGLQARPWQQGVADYIAARQRLAEAAEPSGKK